MPSPVGPTFLPLPPARPSAGGRPSSQGSSAGASGSAPSSKPLAPKPIGIDRDGDGKIDILVTPKPGMGIDTDGDGIIDISFPKEPPAPQPPTAKPPDGKSPDVKPPDVKPPIFKQPSEPLLLGPDGLPIIALPPRNDH